jgi:hypothetical protein
VRKINNYSADDEKGIFYYLTNIDHYLVLIVKNIKLRKEGLARGNRRYRIGIIYHEIRVLSTRGANENRWVGRPGATTSWYGYALPCLAR